MISKVKGKVIGFDKLNLTLDIGPVALDLLVCESLNKKITIDQELSLYTALFYRNDTFSLIGFLHKEELQMFYLLLKAPGIGPISALNILSSYSVAQTVDAIITKNSKFFYQISGIGKKTAEKLVLELQDKVSKLEFKNLYTGDDSKNEIKSIDQRQDLISGLKNLGFSEKNVLEVIKDNFNPADGFATNFANCLKLLRNQQ